MSVTALVCSISVGVGAITLAPGIVQTPRYDGAEVRIELDGSHVTDITVNGPYDKAYSYAVNGLTITTVRLADRLLIDVRGEGLDALRESMVLTDAGQLIWVQIGNADQFRASSGSLFVGRCK